MIIAPITMIIKKVLAFFWASGVKCMTWRVVASCVSNISRDSAFSEYGKKINSPSVISSAFMFKESMISPSSESILRLYLPSCSSVGFSKVPFSKP